LADKSLLAWLNLFPQPPFRLDQNEVNEKFSA
jgi:hypothetical protein